MNPIKKILAPLASLRLTIGLLFIAMIIVLAGTTAQRDLGIQDVQSQFFHAWFSKLHFHYFQPTPTAKIGHLPSEGYWPGYIWFPGGYSLIVLMLANLLAAHSIRFKFRWKRTGIIMIHSGLILLLVGEMVTSLYAVESQMTIDKGKTANYARDIRFPEFAVIDTSPANHDNVTVIPHTRLEFAAGGASITDTKLPFEVKVVKWYDNSSIRGPMQTGSDIDRLATVGDLKSYGVVRAAKISGAEAGGGIDMPSAFVNLLRNGSSLGTYFVTTAFDGEAGQAVAVDGKTYQIALRFTRYYKPYTIYLKDFTHEVYPGTDMAKDFASTVRLVDPTRHVDREVRIWMNHPLRYAGETFYQQSFANHDQTSTLQIVHNPAYTLPYIACAIGGLGLIVHFSMTLISFLRRKLAPAQGTVGAASTKIPFVRTTGAAKRGSPPKLPASAPMPDRYTLSPEPMWRTALIPALAVLIAIICIISQFFTTSPTSPYDLESFGHVPIYIEGRLQPLDSTARNLLGIVSGGRTTFYDEHKQEHPAIEWLADVMTMSNRWAVDKVIRIDHPQIKDLLGLKPEEKLFSWNDIKPQDPDVAAKLDQQARLANEVPVKDQDPYQHGIIELHNHLGQYQRLMQVDATIYLRTMESQPEKLDTIERGMKQALIVANPKLFEDIRAGRLADREADRAFSEAIVRLLPTLPRDQYDFLQRRMLLERLRNMGPEGQLLLVPPAKDAVAWQPLLAAVESSDDLQDGAFLKIAKDYADGRAQEFNSDLAAYLARVQTLPDMQTVNAEVRFNHVNPFYASIVMYIFIFLLTIFSWLGWATPLRRSGYSLLIVALIIHTAGLVLRIYISGRPPVTNLYSASVFIGWGVVFFSAFLEAIFRNGIGMAAGSIAGGLSLFVAAGFAAGEGDTMKQLQAVLDTNIWLATHVVCVTMGYMASVLAGVLAIIYILLGLFVRAFRGEIAKDTSRMIYGIACFAMLFSFVGTILGGIWADQSWGRFWGWDPKENGAVLVVLWNAMILHARWSGIVRERGVAVLAVLGNIVVGWSFVGTNLLGIGLHSYGFMSGVQMLLMIWCGINLALAGLGLAPKKLWAISAETAQP